MASPTLRELTGMNPNPSPISESALVLIDCQQTYREGIMQLVGVEPALKEAASLLKRFRAAGRPVIHIMHDAGPGTPYDVSAPIGQIADIVAPIEGETVVVKNYPSAFEKTALDAELKKLGVKNVIYAGFMTHMCVNSTTRASFNHGYANTVVAGATATRSIPNPRQARTSRRKRSRTSCRRSGDCLRSSTSRQADFGAPRPFFKSSAFIAGMTSISALRPMNKGSAMAGSSDDSFMSKKMSAQRKPSWATK